MFLEVLDAGCLDASFLFSCLLHIAQHCSVSLQLPFESSLQAKNLKNRNISPAVSVFSQLEVWCQCCKFEVHDAAKRHDAHP